MNALHNIHLSSSKERWIWELDTKGQLSTKSPTINLGLNQNTFELIFHDTIWSDFYPKKIKFFLREISHSAINTLEKLHTQHIVAPSI